MPARQGTSPAIEWPTIALIAACSLVWMLGVWLIGQHDAVWALPLLALPVALHSSLQHEVIHGHPTRWPLLNMLMVLPAVGLFLPFHRFRDLHLVHHHEADLTDPGHDPESPFVDPERWAAMPGWRRRLAEANHTLAGRLVLGPLINSAVLIAVDVKSGGRRALIQWLIHVPALAPVLWWLDRCGVSVWHYALLAAWPGMSILMLRTYLEHDWAEDPKDRSAVVERGGIFAFLFLNNHLHAVHHRWPGAAWYRLPALWRRMRGEGGGFPRYTNYGTIARRHMFRARGPLFREG